MRKLFILLLLCPLFIYSQDESDTAISVDTIQKYYIDKSDMLILKPYLIYKLNSIEVIKNDTRLKLSPNSPFGIGIGVNYKWIGIAAGIGLPHTSNSIDKRGKTNSLDIQFNVYSSRFGADAYLQLYKGYYNNNPQDFMPWEEDYYPKIPDMKTISMGVHLYYVFNYKKFSNKAFYSRSQIQIKSAGSFIMGYFFNYDEVESPQGFIPSEFPDTVANSLDIKAFRYYAMGISLGYTYTWVISKNFYLNATAIPGFGYKDIKLTNSLGDQGAEKQPHAQLLLRGNFGYENKYFYAGVSGMTLIRTITYKDYNIDLATEHIRFYIGKRFNLKKKKASPKK